MCTGEKRAKLHNAAITQSGFKVVVLPYQLLEPVLPPVCHSTEMPSSTSVVDASSIV